MNLSSKQTVTITTFYHFVRLENLTLWQDKLLTKCRNLEILGTILLAPEGINATIAGSNTSIAEMVKYLVSFPEFAEMPFKYSYHNEQPFAKMKVRLKPEIVAMGRSDLDVSSLRGTYVPAEQWDDFTSKEDVVVLDTRNLYETKVGAFENAVIPEINNFREFPEWVDKNLASNTDKKIAMFCTGGIRCEKTTALLREKGFKEVYHLEGGILKYLEATNNKNKNWWGACFVFDERVAVDENLQATTVNCVHCGKHFTTEDLKFARQNSCTGPCQIELATEAGEVIASV